MLSVLPMLPVLTVLPVLQMVRLKSCVLGNVLYDYPEDEEEAKNSQVDYLNDKR